MHTWTRVVIFRSAIFIACLIGAWVWFSKGSVYAGLFYCAVALATFLNGFTYYRNHTRCRHCGGKVVGRTYPPGEWPRPAQARCENGHYWNLRRL